MRLSRFYSDQPEIFSPIDFVAGLNVVLAEIRLPENQQRDTHNLGKSTLGRLLDFGFLAGKDPKFFLFRYPQFSAFVFFLEVELEDGSYLTVRRSVADATRIAFKKAVVGQQDFSALGERNWDHWDVPFDRAKDLLDSLLDWRALKPWGYRKGLGYFLRSQDDFRDVFQLKRFANAHADWKPFLAHLLGFDGDLVTQHYAKEDELAEKVRIEQTIQNELGGTVVDVSKIEGMLLLKQQDLDRKQELLDAFDFRTDDKAQTRALVDEVDQRIAHLNGRRYTLQANRKKIDQSLKEDQILFSPDEAREMFAQAGVLFEGQIKRDFDQLLSFNRAITEERQGYLEEERGEIDVELKSVNTELTALGKRRSETLRALSDTDAFLRYKRMSAETVTLRADITSLERQRGHLRRLQELRHDIRTLVAEHGALQELIEQDVEAQNRQPTSRFSQIRLFFNEIIEEVLDRKALLNVFPNTKGHLEFRAEILDEGGNATSADMGFTYRKLLCVAFDLAVLRVHLSDRFPRFAYHDGVLESLDDRKKELLLTVLRAYAARGLQSIITLIDSDLPKRTEDEPVFDDAEIIVRLHDEGEQGRLFRMPSW
ncbi:DUF2326 domain-containing protein [Brevundimonas sp. BR2-1]|jgi:uncharacterized protein YydD (DUF2326 family)|uniref:DUF2326 domain-containing protein n=1 Tax=unclassified Brevundimonas TaxID=2622653 RepID=UPI0025BDDBC3|nr:DUF2326 domain-containing protein [Brevundimonas sp. UBA7664]